MSQKVWHCKMTFVAFTSFDPMINIRRSKYAVCLLHLRLRNLNRSHDRNALISKYGTRLLWCLSNLRTQACDCQRRTIVGGKDHLNLSDTVVDLLCPVGSPLDSVLDHIAAMPTHYLKHCQAWPRLQSTTSLAMSQPSTPRSRKGFLSPRIASEVLEVPTISMRDIPSSLAEL